MFTGSTALTTLTLSHMKKGFSNCAYHSPKCDEANEGSGGKQAQRKLERLLSKRKVSS